MRSVESPAKNKSYQTDEKSCVHCSTQKIKYEELNKERDNLSVDLENL